jgi:hypothetical protein
VGHFVYLKNDGLQGRRSFRTVAGLPGKVLCLWHTVKGVSILIKGLMAMALVAFNGGDSPYTTRPGTIRSSSYLTLSKVSVAAGLKYWFWP